MSANVVHLGAINSGAGSAARNRTVPPKRILNKTIRTREYLISNEVERCMHAARRIGRHGHRDGTLILLAYRRTAFLRLGFVERNVRYECISRRDASAVAG